MISLSDPLVQLNWQMLTLLHKICTPISLLGIPFSPLFLWSMHCQGRQSSIGTESPCTLFLSVPNFKDNAIYHMHSIHLGSLPLPVGLEGRGTRCFFSCAVRFKLSCSYPLSNHLWSGGRFTPYHLLWGWSFSFTCTLIKTTRSPQQTPKFCLHNKHPNIQRLFHHPLNIYVLKLKIVALQGS